MSSFTHRLLCSAVLSVGLMTMAVPASAADVKMVGTVSKITLSANGSSATVVLKDAKSGSDVTLTITDDETLDKFMGREMRTRYTNPEWVKAMLKEGYAGARFVMKVTEHLWGWQVTVPEAVVRCPNESQSSTIRTPGASRGTQT